MIEIAILTKHVSTVSIVWLPTVPTHMMQVTTIVSSVILVTLWHGNG